MTGAAAGGARPQRLQFVTASSLYTAASGRSGPNPIGCEGRAPEGTSGGRRADASRYEVPAKARQARATDFPRIPGGVFPLPPPEPVPGRTAVPPAFVPAPLPAAIGATRECAA